MKVKLFASFVIFISLCSFSLLPLDNIKNYYGTSETIVFNDINYKLIASYHPSANYYKQEYVPSGESGDHYNTMLIIDFYLTDQPVKRLVEIKEKEMTERKKIDPIVNFERFENDQLGEFLLDFILSDSSGDKLSLVEHDVFRYKSHTTKSGKKGLMLFGLSQRGYGDGITNFLNLVKSNKIDNINKVAGYSIPDIDIN